MSEAPIPAWKRAGLKRSAKPAQTSPDSYDPLKEGLKRVHESGETKKPTKPPKRAKVAKADRPQPIHEIDQLAYLRQFSEDRANWKFSKQKQNWILKHMFTDITDDKYDRPLLDYIDKLQGAARNWVAEDARKVVDAWNKFMREDAETKDLKINDAEAGESEPAKTDSSDPKGDLNDDDDNKAARAPGTPQAGDVDPQHKQKPAPAPAPAAPKPPSEKIARRARTLLKLVAGEEAQLEFLEEEA